MTAAPIDMIVRTGSAELLQETVQQLPGCIAVVVDGTWNGATCRLRVFSGAGFLRFALPRQGYGEIVREEVCRLPEAGEAPA